MTEQTKKLNVTKAQLRTIRRHYGLKRPVTEAEGIAEIENLYRRKESGRGFYNIESRLAADLGVI